MAIEAKIILYTNTWKSQELVTFQLKYPRFIHCFDDKTEILVKEKKGYPYFAKFSEAMKIPDILVGQVREKDLSVEFVNPIAWIEKDYDGEMVEISYERLSMMVTPEHRLLVDSRKSKHWKREVIQAADLLSDHTTKKINKCGSLAESQRTQSVNSHLAKLIAFFVSDGHTPKEGLKSNFHLKKQRKISEVKNLLNRCNIEFVEKFNSDKTTTIWFDTQPWMKQCYDETRAKKLPDFLWCLDKNSYESFKQGLFESDGNVKNQEYNNSCEALIDQIQVLAHINNDSFNKRVYDDGIWKVSFQKEKTPTIRKDKSSVAKSVPYQGKVYCVSVPSTFVMVRRDGIVHISGNCELMTHRMFSRNASSSRAIPVKKMIQDIKDDPAMPVYWGKNQSGMQARVELSEEEISKCKSLWLEQRDETIARVEKLIEIGLHKQTANRLLEPWAHIHVIVSATEWKNWFELRSHPDAQPEIKELSDKMKVELEEKRKTDREISKLMITSPVWHLPYIKKEEKSKYKLSELLKMSTARCARVSYMNHDGTNPDPEKDFELHDKLVVSKPQHMSPAEHQAVSADPDQFYGNFKGWKQYRKFLEEGFVL